VTRPTVAAGSGLNESSVRLEPLAVGSPLCTLPLWLNSYDAVPVDLDQSYETTFQTLRIDGPIAIIR
jgi:hypothetical protein